MASPSSGDLFRKKVRETVGRIIQEAGLEGHFRVVMEYTSPHGSIIREQGRKVDVAVLLKRDKPSKTEENAVQDELLKRDKGPSPYLFAALLKRDEDLPYLFLECKWQSERGSAQDRLFRAAEEARRDRALGVHSGGGGRGSRVYGQCSALGPYRGLHTRGFFGGLAKGVL
ncbi:MAG: hypothetical protein ACO2OU_05460 [Thermus aquaticus]|jgi:hypothetical protein|uniref:hypothetical protein n=1 Tax=Thermus aquaticus TaxID=271 RepID=UPI003C08909A